MKNILLHFILFGNEKVPGISHNRSSIFKKSNEIFTLNNISSYRATTLFLMLMANLGSLAQNGEVVNEGIFQIEPSTIVSALDDFTNEQTGALTNDGNLILKADFSNYGTTGFSASSEGYTRFEGNLVQELAGSAPINLNHVLFANTVSGISFHLNNDVNIYGLADFNSGIVDNTNYIGRLIFHENADHTNTSNFSYVEGSVYKIGKSNFTFPIGKEGHYRWASIADIPGAATFNATYFLENSNNLHPHILKPDGIQNIDDAEYWILTKDIPHDEEVLISLSWDEETTPPSIYAAAASNGITIVRWDEASNMWIDEGGVANMDTKSVTTAIKSDGIYTLARINQAQTLPCNVMVYNAVTPNGDNVNDYFRIDVGNDDCAKSLNVMIFNRWGVKVFESNNYGLGGDLFDGYSAGRLTLNDGKQLPSGTYYYILDYQYESGSGVDQHRKAGFLNLSGN
ncbi:gliding motility-associated C-terminal domain-containing protein [Aequorivita sp. SDUM287046]|uniref:Gliding motility-associated C-terminal domain-containing protein n=1 Tax=Aequorivita aurantiaca TaxID=3053356 RepID=A0ABT8DJ86_9FLAO|nr:gliding motility-associated C-terminal domain-containing protein [Aequorivita aurantiaca]MDN3725083.1 gliding motility-associated C-terminal domain-containing protein [Aequorivita aurantiaca]